MESAPLFLHHLRQIRAPRAALVIHFPGVLSRAAANVKRQQDQQSRKVEKSYKLYVAEHYASKDFLSDLKREITDSIRDFGRRD